LRNALLRVAFDFLKGKSTLSGNSRRAVTGIPQLLELKAGPPPGQLIRFLGRKR
jgi:hypothetical protein